MLEIIINRTVFNQIDNWLNKGKIIILYGARQVGKTTISKMLIDKFGKAKSLYLNCDLSSVREILETKNLDQIIKIFQGKNFIILDEAQNIKDIGLVLKIIHDEHPEIQLIATGSSSFDLSNKLSEPLTGRNAKFMVYPLSLGELSFQYGLINVKAMFENIMRFGMYPDVQGSPELEAIEKLDFLSGDYLYKDILSLESIKKPQLLRNLLKALALQIGNEVNYNELANLLDTSAETINRYLDLLEKSFIVFRLDSFSRNMRNELKKGFKVYFYDLGIRNALLGDFKQVENRGDIGGLFENFCILERKKQMQGDRGYGNQYFWRSYLPDKEIDYIEEKDGKLYLFEFKWNPKAGKKAHLPKNFFEAYNQKLDKAGNSTNLEFRVIDSGNWWEWLM